MPHSPAICCLVKIKSRKNTKRGFTSVQMVHTHTCIHRYYMHAYMMLHGILRASASMTCVKHGGLGALSIIVNPTTRRDRNLDCFDNGVFKRVHWDAVRQFAASSPEARAIAMGSAFSPAALCSAQNSDLVDSCLWPYGHLGTHLLDVPVSPSRRRDSPSTRGVSHFQIWLATLWCECRHSTRPCLDDFCSKYCLGCKTWLMPSSCPRPFLLVGGWVSFMPFHLPCSFCGIAFTLRLWSLWDPFSLVHVWSLLCSLV